MKLFDDASGNKPKSTLQVGFPFLCFILRVEEWKRNGTHLPFADRDEWNPLAIMGSVHLRHFDRQMGRK